MTPTRDADETALEPFFAAARQHDTKPPQALMSAILGDAAEVSFARRAPPAAAPRRWQPGRLVAPIGGWRAVAALAACAVAGFWLGIAGEVSIDGTTVWAGSATASETASDQVGAFFDLASVEG